MTKSEDSALEKRMIEAFRQLTLIDRASLLALAQVWLNNEKIKTDLQNQILKAKRAESKK